MIPKLLFESSSYDQQMLKILPEYEIVRSAQRHSANDLGNKSALKCLGLVPCCSVMLGAVWNKLGARVVPKPSIPVPRCFHKSGKVVLESVPEEGFILNVMLHEKCEANPPRCFIYQHVCSF